MTVLTSFANGGSGKDFRDTFNDMLAKLLPDAIATAMRAQAFDLTAQEAEAYAAISSPTTYAAFISQIDSLIAGTPAVRTTLGNSSDGSTPVYSYTVGTGKKVWFVTAGMHSGENHGQLAAIRWFERIAKRATPWARKVFASYKCILIANANPAGFTAGNGGRTNANGVNLNRNFDFFWSAYDQTQGTDNAKGASAFSEVEAQYIRDIFVNNDVRIYTDCHNMGTTGMTTDLVIEPPSAALYGNRQAVLGAMAQWRAATGGSVDTLSNGASFEPTGMNWASYYMTVVKKNSDAVAALIECRSNQDGSDDRNATAELMRKYVSAIMAIGRAHMEGSGRMDQRTPFTLFQRRDNNASAVSYKTGGTLIDDVAYAPLQYDAMQGITIAANTYRSYRDLIRPSAGTILHHVQLDLISSGSAEQVDLALQWNGTASGLFSKSFVLSATNNAVTPVNLMWMTAASNVPDAATIDRFAIVAKKAATGTTNPRFTKFVHVMTFFPYAPLDTFSAQTIVPQPT